MATPTAQDVCSTFFLSDRTLGHEVTVQLLLQDTPDTHTVGDAKRAFAASWSAVGALVARVSLDQAMDWTANGEPVDDFAAAVTALKWLEMPSTREKGHTLLNMLLTEKNSIALEQQSLSDFFRTDAHGVQAKSALLAWYALGVVDALFGDDAAEDRHAAFFARAVFK